MEALRKATGATKMAAVACIEVKKQDPHAHQCDGSPTLRQSSTPRCDQHAKSVPTVRIHCHPSLKHTAKVELPLHGLY